MLVAELPRIKRQANLELASVERKIERMQADLDQSDFELLMLLPVGIFLITRSGTTLTLRTESMTVHRPFSRVRIPYIDISAWMPRLRRLREALCASCNRLECTNGQSQAFLQWGHLGPKLVTKYASGWAVLRCEK